MNYKKGDRGEMVKRIQQALKSAGYGVIPDGKFGVITHEAVVTYQRENGLVADGIVGPATLAKLLAAKFSVRKSRRRIDAIVIHCTASKPGVDLTVEDVRKMHKKQGWSDIGYHYLIRLDGRIENGRDVDLIGAHVADHNAHTIGVCYVGGLDNNGNPYDTRTQNQKDSLLSLLRMLRAAYPKAVIKGHRDYSPDKNGNGTVEPSEWIKACPCFSAIPEYIRL